MKNICSNCGSELKNETFCPKCGNSTKKISNTDINQSKILTKTEDSVINIIKCLFYAFSAVVYIILMLKKWFKISVPLLGTSEFYIYDLYEGFDNIFKYVDSNNPTEIFLKAFSVILIILGIGVLFYSIMTFISILKRDKNTVANISTSASFAIAESSFAIIAVWLVRAYIKYELGSIDLGDLGTQLGSAASSIISFTKQPIILIIFSIIGKMLFNELENTPSQKNTSQKSTKTSDKLNISTYDTEKCCCICKAALCDEDNAILFADKNEKYRYLCDNCSSIIQSVSGINDATYDFEVAFALLSKATKTVTDNEVQEHLSELMKTSSLSYVSNLTKTNLK